MDIRGRMDHVELSRIRSIGEKVTALRSQGRKIIPLQIGEPDFPTPSFIIEAAKKAMNAGHTHYAPNRGLLELRNAISRKLKKDNNIDADPVNEIIITDGCAEALFISIMALIRPGDEVLLIDPSYIAYQQLVKTAGGIPVFIHADEENNWLPRIDDLRNAITSKTRMILISSPCNPTGAVYPKDILESIAQLACDSDIFVVSDEVYEKLIYDGAHHFSIASLPSMRDRTITINGFSKAYAMTGWRLGYVAACEELVLPMLKVHQYAVGSSNIIAQYAAIDAIEKGEQCIEEMRKEYDSRRRFLLDAFNDIEGLSCSIPHGTFYIYPNISASKMTGNEFAQTLLEDYGVATVHGSAFDSFADTNIRISYASSLENLKEAVAHIKEMLRSVRKLPKGLH